MADVDIEFRLDRAGVGDIMRSPEAHAVVGGLAHEIRDAVYADVNADPELDPDDEIEVLVDVYTTDRAAAAVTIAHPLGRHLQADHGALTRPAARLGLEVRSR